MGTAQTAVTQSLSLPASNTSTSYELDIRLLNKIVPPPSSFGSAVEKLIEEIATILHSIPPHPLEQYIMDGIDHRFSRYNAVN